MRIWPATSVAATNRLSGVSAAYQAGPACSRLRPHALVVARLRDVLPDLGVLLLAGPHVPRHAVPVPIRYEERYPVRHESNPPDWCLGRYQVAPASIGVPQLQLGGTSGER